MMVELKRQKFKGAFCVEYEYQLGKLVTGDRRVREVLQRDMRGVGCGSLTAVTDRIR